MQLTGITLAKGESFTIAFDGLWPSHGLDIVYNSRVVAVLQGGRIVFKMGLPPKTQSYVAPDVA